MASETKELTITWKDDYYGEAREELPAIDDTNTPFFDTTNSIVSASKGNSVELKYTGYFYRNRNVKVQVTWTDPTEKTTKHSPEVVLHTKESEDKRRKFIVKVIIDEADKSKHEGSWFLKVYNVYFVKPVSSRKTLKVDN